jgi:hypothetical protein
MTRRKKSKPSSPEDIARRAAERREAKAEAQRLEAQGVSVTMDAQTGKIARAVRVDVFSLLLSRGALGEAEHDAFRGYQQDVHVALGAETPERRPDYIRASTEGAPGQNVTQRMVDASEVVDLTLRRLGSRDKALLNALMQEGAASVTRWRITVQNHTGETRDECQAAAIRYLGANLLNARTVAIKAAAEMRERRATALAANDAIERKLTA